MTARKNSAGGNMDAVSVKIASANNQALHVLKPSKRDLKYGLELHRKIVVIDSYGFAPYCAVSAELMNQAVTEGASQAECNSLQSEMRVANCVYNENDRNEFQAAWNAAGLTAIFQNAGIFGNNGSLPEIFAHFCMVIDKMPEFLIRATTQEDILEAKKSGRHALLFSSNNVPLANDGSSVSGELRFLRSSFSAGFRQAHLTYNRANQLADGCAESRNGGLTDLGRAAVEAMNDAGIIVDVAHTGWQSSYEAALASRLPIVASHTACCGLFEHCRGKPDHVMKAIAERDGIIGVVWVPAFLGKNADINTMLDHVDYLVKLVGIDHVAMGTDSTYVTCLHEEENRKKRLPAPPKYRPALSSFWPAGMDTGAPDWAMTRKDSLAWVNRPYATVGLVQRGYSDADIAKIMGGNHLRVLKTVLDARRILGVSKRK